MEVPKVAIITRTYNRPLFLKRALQSVGEQNFEDYIHVIVNDGGDREVIDTLIMSLNERQKNRTKVFHRDKPSGAPDTIFNESIDRVESEYFAIHDDDDTWHPDFLKYTVDAIEREPNHLGAVVVRTDKIIEILDTDVIIEKKKTSYMPDMQAISLYRQCIDNQFTPISTLFSRSAYSAVGKFDDTLPVVGDWEFGIRLLMKYEAEFIDPGYALAYYHHRKSGDNSFVRHDHRKYVTRIANMYLRRELAVGELGVGYIMSKLKYDDDKIKDMIKGFIPTGIKKQVINRIRQR